MKENLEFELNGCHIDGMYGSYLELVVEPNEERLIKIVKDKGA